MVTPARTCVFLALLISFSAAISLEKRADDVDMQSLMTLVQQQASRIAAMEAGLTSLQTSDQQQSNAISELNTKMNDVTARLNNPVFFTAHMTGHSVDIGTTNSPLKFDAVVSNVGGAYSPLTGVFTAPVAGVYVFYAQLMKTADAGEWMHWVLDKAGTVLCMNRLESSVSYDKSSCLATVQVQKGEQVFVRRFDGSGHNALDGKSLCSFSGYLASVDT